MPKNHQSVEEAVIAKLQDLGIHPGDITPERRIIDDLRITSDDASFVLIPDLEKGLGVTLDASDWRSVFTVQDAIDLLSRAVSKKESG